jgi:hypothetical protein
VRRSHREVTRLECRRADPSDSVRKPNFAAAGVRFRALPIHKQVTRVALCTLIGGHPCRGPRSCQRDCRRTFTGTMTLAAPTVRASSTLLWPWLGTAVPRAVLPNGARFPSTHTQRRRPTSLMMGPWRILDDRTRWTCQPRGRRATPGRPPVSSALPYQSSSRLFEGARRAAVRQEHSSRDYVFLVGKCGVRS